MRAPAMVGKLLFGCLVLAGLSTTGVSQAACRQADLTGAWYAMGISGNVVGSYFDITNRCKVQLSSNGTVLASASSCTYFDWTGRGTANITGGMLTVSASCAVTGYIGICEPNGCTNMRVTFSQMDKSKATFPLLGYSGSDAGFRYVLTFVKQ